MRRIRLPSAPKAVSFQTPAMVWCGRGPFGPGTFISRAVSAAAPWPPHAAQTRYRLGPAPPSCSFRFCVDGPCSGLT